MNKGDSAQQNKRDMHRGNGGGTAPGKTDRQGESNAVEFEQQEITFKCDEINKRSIGRAIIKFCGNEGTQNDSNKATLRRLMQAVISHLEQEKPDIWKNAEVKIYDDNFDVYSIRSGNGHALFLATFDGLGNPQVVKTSRSRIESNRVQGKQCSLM
ncbi:uncharacterized protein LOC123538449 [Mercenaria mercenaria]|uniref:uncharacterized protein LOC123538449 n=1 Tax=Mercenaria mercenaria TaxID=6596 RepID=UPI00234F9A4F|nr:uncharacterized protein LOC123538449 [Mercenaria mercenaria]